MKIDWKRSHPQVCGIDADGHTVSVQLPEAPTSNWIDAFRLVHARHVEDPADEAWRRPLDVEGRTLTAHGVEPRFVDAFKSYVDTVVEEASELDRRTPDVEGAQRQSEVEEILRRLME